MNEFSSIMMTWQITLLVNYFKSITAFFSIRLILFILCIFSHSYANAALIANKVTALSKYYQSFLIVFSIQSI